MQNFYYPAKSRSQAVPHILGLSASPVVNAKSGGLETLERNLDSHACTPKRCRTELMQYVHIPELQKHFYCSTPEYDGSQSPLYVCYRQALREYDIENDPYVQALKSSIEASAMAKIADIRMSRKTYCYKQLKSLWIRMNVILQNIGSAALKWYFDTCLDRMHRAMSHADNHWMPDLAEKEKHHLATVLDRINSQAYLDPCIPDTNLTPKTQLLLDILHREAGPSFTGIIFAEQRSTVAALAHVISTQTLTATSFNIGTYVGSASSARYSQNIGDVVEITDQQQDLELFQSGKKNLIVATSVLEEGIDVSSCQTVICFDPPMNLVSFVQRRGRARKQDSRYIVLLDDSDRKADPAKWQDLEERMKAAYTSDLRNAQLAYEMEGQTDFDSESYTIPSTGAVLTSQNAKSHLYHFCATLLTASHCDLRPVFSCREDASTKMVVSDVELPAAVHQDLRRTRSSRPFRTERGAMADAAFVAYIALHKAGLVNDNLLPLRTRYEDIPGETTSQPSMVMVLPRLNPWSLHVYDQQKWSSSSVQIDIAGETFGELLMHLPLECRDIPQLRLFWSGNRHGAATILPGEPDQMEGPAQRNTARRETLTLLASIYQSGRIDYSRSDFAALFQPYGYDASQVKANASKSLLDLPHTVSEKDFGLLRVKGQIGRAFIFDRMVLASDSSLNPIVYARKFPKSRSFLRRPYVQSSNESAAAVELALDDCTMDVLPSRYAFAAACIPSILHHVENTLIARELQETILRPVSITNLDLLMESTTSSSANAERNYERLEFLGDSVLKFCTHVQLMAQHPFWPESFLTSDKGRTNRNASLAKAAMRTGVDRFITTTMFTAHKWQPPYISDCTMTTEEKVPRSTKTLADVVEALIGASYHEKGIAGALECIRIFLPDEIWTTPDEAHGALFNAGPRGDLPNSELVEEIVDYHFATPLLLLEATTHASTKNSSTLCYERLEFLGDAVLDQIIVPELFRYTPPRKNHEMHQLKQSVVNAHLLGFLCMELTVAQERNDVVRSANSTTHFEIAPSWHSYCLADFLRCDSAVSAQRSAALSKHKDLRLHLLKELGEGKEYPWSLLYELHPPKFFSDMIESVLGAIYIDTHGSAVACADFMEHIGLMKLMRRFLNEHPEVRHPKERLGILADKERVHYDLKKATIPDATDERIFECTVRIGDKEVVKVGGCRHPDEAEVKAAAEAIKVLEVRGAGDEDARDGNGPKSDENDDDDYDNDEHEDHDMDEAPV
ncbi:hypothetical protein AAFC00_006178 [Neodothiora populina]